MISPSTFLKRLRVVNRLFFSKPESYSYNNLPVVKALYLSSFEGRVWMNALHRIYVEKTLFEPAFLQQSCSFQNYNVHLWVPIAGSQRHLRRCKVLMVGYRG